MYQLEDKAKMRFILTFVPHSYCLPSRLEISFSDEYLDRIHELTTEIVNLLNQMTKKLHKIKEHMTKEDSFRIYN